MSSKERNSTTQSTKTQHKTMKELIDTIIYIFNTESNVFGCPSVITQHSIKDRLKTTYLMFAEEFNLNKDIAVYGCATSLGNSIESYLIDSKSDEKIKIDIRKYKYSCTRGYFRYDQKTSPHVIITMHEKFEEAEKALIAEFKKVNIKTQIKKPEKPKSRPEYYRTGADDWGGIYGA